MGTCMYMWAADTTGSNMMQPENLCICIENTNIIEYYAGTHGVHTRRTGNDFGLGSCATQYFGGMIITGGQLLTMRSWKWDGMRLTKFPDMPNPHVWHCQVVLNDWLYAISGSDWIHNKRLSIRDSRIHNVEENTESEINENDLISAVDMYDSRTNQWKTVKNLNVSRKYATACVFMGSIYVIGGVDETGELWSTIEFFDDTKKSQIQSFNGIGIRNAGIVAPDDENFIIFGGFLDAKGETKNEMQYEGNLLSDLKEQKSTAPWGTYSQYQMLKTDFLGKEWGMIFNGEGTVISFDYASKAFRQV